MNDSVFNLLFQTSFTVNQLFRRANLVKTFYEKYVYGGTQPKPQDFFTNPLDWQWFLTYQSPLYQSLSDPGAREELNNLESEMKKVKPITCFTAIHIPEDRLEPLVSRLRQEINPNVILETRVSPEIIGGCVIINKGLVKDYSLRNKISMQKVQILQLLQGALPI